MFFWAKYFRIETNSSCSQVITQLQIQLRDHETQKQNINEFNQQFSDTIRTLFPLNVKIDDATVSELNAYLKTLFRQISDLKGLLSQIFADLPNLP
jgi:hypothetical protein